MNFRNVVVCVLVLLCLTTVWAAIAHHRQILTLRDEEQRLAVEAEHSTQLPPVAPSTLESTTDHLQAEAVSSELLKLRGEVGLLRQRRRELEGVRQENERLRLQVASMLTNPVSGQKLPPGYIRKQHARFVGYNTPEDTLQSFLWALANHNYQGVLDAFSPQMAEQFGISVPATQSSNFFQQVETQLPGLGVVGRKEASDGVVELTVEFAPGVESPIRLALFNGQWKLVDPHL